MYINIINKCNKYTGTLISPYYRCELFKRPLSYQITAENMESLSKTAFKNNNKKYPYKINYSK